MKYKHILILLSLLGCFSDAVPQKKYRLPFSSKLWKDKDMRIIMLCDARKTILIKNTSVKNIIDSLGLPDRIQGTSQYLFYDIFPGAEPCRLILTMANSNLLDTFKLDCDYPFDNEQLSNCDRF